MPGRRPGPQCVTDGDSIDSGTNCRHRTSPPGPLGIGPTSARKPKPEPVRFAALWAAYPSSKPYVDPKTGKVPEGYDNQCAIKVSVALAEAGTKLDSFKGASVTIKGVKIAIRAQELAAWLKAQHIDGVASVPETITGDDWEKKIKGRTGIVYFADYWARGNEKVPTGDHIDLWNGSRLTASGFTEADLARIHAPIGLDIGAISPAEIAVSILAEIVATLRKERRRAT